MIEATLKDIIEAQSALKNLKNTSMRARPAFLLARIIREVDKEIENEHASHIELIKKYGDKDENGQLIVNEDGNYTIPQEELEGYFKEYQELLQTVVNLNCDYINLADIEEAIITPEEIQRLMVFIHE